MKKFLALLLLLPAIAFGGPYDIVMMQRNPTDTGQLTRTVAHPAGSADGISGYDGGTQLPVYFTAGSNLSISSGVIDAIPQSWSIITGKPSFSPVATSGAYADLSGKPVIPAAQVQTDWSATAGAGVLLNKPATFAPSAHTQAFDTITATPTTLNGYGITDALTASALTPYATSASVTAGLATKFNSPAGTTAQYVRGDGSLATLPTAKRIETYVATTDANGLVTVTYPTAFPSTPSVQPGPPSDSTQSWVLVSSTATGFSVRLVQRSVLTVLSVQVLAGVVSNVPNAPAQVLVVGQ